MMSRHRLPFDGAREKGMGKSADSSVYEGPGAGSRAGVGSATVGTHQRNGVGSGDRMGPPANLPPLGDGFDRHLPPMVSSPSFPSSPSTARQLQLQHQQEREPLSPPPASSPSRSRSHSGSSYWDDHTRVSSRPVPVQPPQLPEPSFKFLMTSRQALPPLGAFSPPSTSPSSLSRPQFEQQAHHHSPRVDDISAYGHYRAGPPSRSLSQSQQLSQSLPHQSQLQARSNHHGLAQQQQLQQQPYTAYSSEPFRPYRENGYMSHASMTAGPPSLPTDEAFDRDSPPRKLTKTHVPSACLNCKRAHLACDVSRPCRRCVNLGKTDTCIDVQHKKRGRPRLRDRDSAPSADVSAITLTNGDENNLSSTTSLSGLPVPASHHGTSISSSSTSSTMRQSPRSEPTTSIFSSSVHDKVTVMSPISTTVDAIDTISSVSSSSMPYHSNAKRDRSLSSTIASRPLAYPSKQPMKGDVVVSSSSSSSSSPIIALILSTNLQCARCSVESATLLDLHPSEIVGRSLFELIHPSESVLLEQLWLGLIDPVGIEPQNLPVDLETVSSLPPALLMTPASGTVFLQETMRLRQRSGMYDFYSLRLHLGGGLGADLYQSQTLHRAYIVASLLKLGNDATHADPAMLRASQWDSEASARGFRAPVSSRLPANGTPHPSTSQSALPPMASSPSPPQFPTSLSSSSTSAKTGTSANPRSSVAFDRSAWRLNNALPPLKNGSSEHAFRLSKQHRPNRLYEGSPDHGAGRPGSFGSASSSCSASCCTPMAKAEQDACVRHMPYTRPGAA